MDLYEEINSIDLNEYEIRDNLDDRSIDGNIENSADFLSLLKDIESNGILVPLIFARKGEKELELISGRRRLEAVRALNNALRSEDKPTIQIIPAKIIKEDVPDSIIYQIAYSENSLRKDLSQSAKVEAMFLPLFNACNSDFAKAKSKQELSKRNFAMEGFLKELKTLAIKINNNRNSITLRDNSIIEELKKLAIIFNNMSYLKMLNSIVNYKLTIVEKRLITHYGLDLKDLLLCKKTKHNSSLNKIIVIKDAKNNYFKLNTKTNLRLDVSELFNEGYDYSKSGIIGEGKLENNLEYPFKIYFLIEKDNKNILIDTGQMIER